MITEEQARDAAKSIAAIELVDFDVDARTLLNWAAQELAGRDAERIERAKPIDAEWVRSIGLEWDAQNKAWFDFVCGVSIEVSATTKIVRIGGGGDDSVELDWFISSRGQLLDLLAALKGGA